MIEHGQKEAFVREMQDDLAKAAGVVFLDYTGLTVAEVESFRRKSREANLKYRVVKNTLMGRALAGTPAESAKKMLKGTPTGVLFGFQDPVVTAKVATEFAKTTQHLKVKGGILENKAISRTETETLAQMPSRVEILGQVMGMTMGTGQRLLAQIKSPAGRLVGVLDKIAEGEKSE